MSEAASCLIIVFYTINLTPLPSAHRRRLRDRYRKVKSADLLTKTIGRMGKGSIWSGWHTWRVFTESVRREEGEKALKRVSREGGATRLWLWLRNGRVIRCGKAWRTWRHAVHMLREMEIRRRGQMKCVLQRLVGGQKYIAFNLWKKNALFDEGMNRIVGERDGWRRRVGVWGLEGIVGRWKGRRMARAWKAWRDRVGREGRRFRGIEKLVEWGRRGEKRSLWGRWGRWKAVVEGEKRREVEEEMR